MDKEIILSTLFHCHTNLDVDFLLKIVYAKCYYEKAMVDIVCRI